jgi:hypothetical protein
MGPDMTTKNKAKSEHLIKSLAASEAQKVTSASVLCFSTKQADKKLTEAKRRVYQAASNLKW